MSEQTWDNKRQYIELLKVSIITVSGKHDLALAHDFMIVAK